MQTRNIKNKKSLPGQHEINLPEVGLVEHDLEAVHELFGVNDYLKLALLNMILRQYMHCLASILLSDSTPNAAQ